MLYYPALSLLVNQYMLISIITSTYNEYQKGGLKRAIASVIQQTYEDWEMIIVGDCAPYGEEIERLIAEFNDTRLRFFNLPKGSGLESPGTIPKLKGISLARGELLAFLDADNEYFPEHLARSAEEFIKNPSLDLVYGDTVVKMSNVKCQMSNLCAFTWKKPEWNKKTAAMLERINFLDMSEPMFRREAYLASGGLSIEHHAADWFLWRAMIRAGRGRFLRSNHRGLIYRTHSLLHHISYYLLMLGVKSDMPYKSLQLSWMQKSIKKRFQKRYGKI